MTKWIWFHTTEATFKNCTVKTPSLMKLLSKVLRNSAPEITTSKINGAPVSPWHSPLRLYYYWWNWLWAKYIVLHLNSLRINFISLTTLAPRPFLKLFIEFVTILLLFFVLVFEQWGMWDRGPPIRGWTCSPCIGRHSLNHGTTREVPFV